MASWSAPKTNWSRSSSNGVYTGDYFNYSDFNRIRNNLEVLSDLAADLYSSTYTASDSLPNKKTSYAQYYVASDLNQIETRLYDIAQTTLGIDYGSKKTYYANGVFWDAAELNRIESACLDMYTRFTNSLSSLRTLKFRLGISGFKW